MAVLPLLPVTVHILRDKSVDQPLSEMMILQASAILLCANYALGLQSPSHIAFSPKQYLKSIKQSIGKTKLFSTAAASTDEQKKSGLGWDSHSAIDEIPESLVRTIDGNDSMRRKFEALCRTAQVRQLNNHMKIFHTSSILQSICGTSINPPTRPAPISFSKYRSAYVKQLRN